MHRAGLTWAVCVHVVPQLPSMREASSLRAITQNYVTDTAPASVTYTPGQRAHMTWTTAIYTLQCVHWQHTLAAHIGTWNLRGDCEVQGTHRGGRHF